VGLRFSKCTWGSVDFFFGGLSFARSQHGLFVKNFNGVFELKISTKISMSVFPRLFLFYRIFGCFFATGVQKHYKKRFAKKIVSKSFYKKIDQKSKTDFFLDFCFITFLGVSR
jgi:hypothetical protein